MGLDEFLAVIEFASAALFCGGVLVAVLYFVKFLAPPRPIAFRMA